MVNTSLQALDAAFRLLVLGIFAHVIFGFIGWFWLVSTWGSLGVALFGATTFTLAGYNWKQQPCFQYTVAWFPWLLLGIATNNQYLAALSFGMVLLAGYYPIGIQIALVAGCATIYWNCPPYWVPMGLALGLVQLVPFFKYLPKTIRANKHDDIGKVPWWHFASLVFPKAFRFNVNGVGYWEMSYYCGILPLFLIWYTTSIAWVLLATSGLLMLGLFSGYLPRIPARWSYTFQFSLVWLACSGLQNLNLGAKTGLILAFLSAFDLLLNNRSLMVTRPYSELPNRPKWAFNTRLTRFLTENSQNKRISGLPYPLFTGHINKLRSLGYSGGMQLKLMAKWRNDTNSNGSGEHDFFKTGKDSRALDAYNVRYAFNRTGIDRWNKTPIKHLYENPRI